MLPACGPTRGTIEGPRQPAEPAEAVRQSFVPISVGTPWGAPWGTTWFPVTGTVPTAWAMLADAGFDGRAELVLDLGFLSGQPGFQAEGLVFDPAGRIVKAIEPGNNHVPVIDDGLQAPQDLRSAWQIVLSSSNSPVSVQISLSNSHTTVSSSRRTS